MGILNPLIPRAMPGPLRDLPSLCFRLLLLAVLLPAGRLGAAEQWYLSNAAGMTLERSPSRLAALRNKYCVSIGVLSFQELPQYLREYHHPSYRIERHTLYENGKETRRQWIFRDNQGLTRLVSALSTPAEQESEASSGDPVKTDPRENLTGFIEIYDENNLITEEHRFSSQGDASLITYFYKRQTLIKAETRVKIPGPPEPEPEEQEGNEKNPGPVKPVLRLITTDTYRYSRSHALRAVERVYHGEVSSDRTGASSSTRLQFPHLGLKSPADEAFVSPGTPYNSEFLPGDARNADAKAGDQVVYTTDDRGKVLSETRRDAEGAIQGEIRNTWAEDRLEAVDWKSGEDEGRTEYEYDAAGDRIMERNYNRGVLERTVRRENGREIEELYLNGKVALRAIWENGRKLSEERIPHSQAPLKK